MKNFFKKAAFVLALAMVLTNIGPAAKASAAEAPGLKYSSRVIYVGGSAFGDYTDNCWTPSKNTAGYKAAYEVTTGKELITVAANGKVTATGNGIGKAVVKVTYTPNGGGQAVTANFTVKVRRNASDVRLVNDVIALVEVPLNVGAEIELKAAKSISGTSYAKGNYGVDNYMTVCSDQVAYKVDNDEVIKVVDGKLVVVGTGTATLTVYTYEYMDKTMTPTKEKPYTITVIGGLIEAKQISATTVQVIMGQPVPDAKADDFSITRVSDTVDFGIKSISLSNDNKIVTIETFSSMNDGEKYKIAYDNKYIVFNATDGTIKSIKINKSVIPYNFASLISIDLLDANDIVIATVKESTAFENNVEWTWESSSGAVYDDKLVLYSKGDTAKLTVTYRTGKYDSEGNEIGVVGPQTFTITAMDVAVDSRMSATIANDQYWPCIYDWSGVTENRTFYAEEDKVLHVFVTDSEGNDITQDLFSDYGYYLESTNENVLIVDSANLHRHTQWSGGHFVDDVGIWADIHAVKAGTANVLVKNSDGRVMFTITINVGSVRRFVGFDINKTSLTLSNSNLASETGNVKITARDQYGNATWVDYSEYISVELLSAPGNDDPCTGVSMNWGDGLNQVNFAGRDIEEGTYRYKITFEKNNVTATKYVTVIIKAPSGSDSYKVLIGGSTNSTYYTWGTRQTTEIRVAHYKGGMLYQYLDYNENNEYYIKELSISNGKYGTKLEYNLNSTITGAVITPNSTLTSTAYSSGSVGDGIDGIGSMDSTSTRYLYPIANEFVEQMNHTTTGTVIRKAISGTRTVKVTVMNNFGKEITVTGSFTVNDYQESMTATVDTTSMRLTDLPAGATIEDMIKKALTFKFEGYKEINDDAEDNCIVVKYIKSSNSTYNGSYVINSNGSLDYKGDGSRPLVVGNKIAVTSVVIGYTRADNEYVEYVVPVNRTFSIN